MAVGNNVSYSQVDTVYRSSIYRVIRVVDTIPSSGQVLPPSFEVEDLENGVYLASFDTLDQALNYVNQKEGKVSVSPNLASTITTKGAIKESKPPVPQAGQTNSDPKTSSLSVPSLSIGQVQNTGLEAANAPVDFAKDISTDIKQAISAVSSAIGDALNALRDAIKAAWEAVSAFFGEVFADDARNSSDAIKAQAQMIKKVADDAKEYAQMAQEAMQEAQQVMEYVMSLPAKFATEIGNALSEAETALTNAISDAVSSATSDIAP